MWGSLAGCGPALSGPSLEDDELQPEYDLTKLGPGVRGKYYTQAMAGRSVFLIARDAERAWPVGDAGNAWNRRR